MRQEVLTGIERRRHWSDAEKLRIVREAGAEGVRLSDIARVHDITRQHIYQWRRELRIKGLQPEVSSLFIPVELTGHEKHADRAGTVSSHGFDRAHRVEIKLRNGRSLRVAADIPEPILQRMMRIAETS